MNDVVKPPAWFWAISVFGLLWNLAGVAAFINDIFFLDPSTLSELQQEFYSSRPGWAMVAYGVAVFGGAFGCLALLLRRAWALPMLLVCLVGIVIQNAQALTMNKALETFGPQGLILPAMVFAIAVFLAWFAHFSKHRGWLQ